MRKLKNGCLVSLGVTLAGFCASAGQAENWGGAHVGVFAGQAQNDNVFTDVDGFTGPGPGFVGVATPAGTEFAYDDNSVSYGALAGYDWQSGNFVFGIETDFSFVNTRSSVLADTAELDETVYTDVDYVATLRGRVGWTTGPVMLFGTAGIALGSYKNEMVDIDQDDSGQYTVFDTDDSFTDQNESFGFVVGAGVEVKFHNRWSIRAEGQYVDFGTSTNFVNLADDSNSVVGPQQFDVENEMLILRMAIVYAF